MTKKTQFTDIPQLHLTARDQARCVADWERFLESGLAQPRFTKHLYMMLTAHFGYTAHYNQKGFYDSYFTPGLEDKALFFFRDFRGHLLELQRYWLWIHLKPLVDEMGGILDRHETRLVMSLTDKKMARKLAELKSAADELGYDLVKRKIK